MKKWMVNSVLLSLGLVIGYFAAQFFNSESFSNKKEAGIAPKALNDHLRYLESTLDTIHHIKPNPIPGEWLYHNEESQQYPHGFLKQYPNIVEGERTKVYIQPIGEFTNEQSEIIAITGDYLNVFYGVVVVVLAPISADEIPDDNRRIGMNGMEQLQTGYIMNDILGPSLPEDGRALMAFTTDDLYPDDSYNFVFGQGSLGGNVGVYSIARFGNPAADSAQFDLCLKRTLKVASHELGHIFGIKHCVNYECIMNGSNHIEETDSKPVYLCPLDLLKVSQGLGIDEVYRYRKLAQFWNSKGYEKEANFYDFSAYLLEENQGRKEGGLHDNQ